VEKPAGSVYGVNDSGRGRPDMQATPAFSDFLPPDLGDYVPEFTSRHRRRKRKGDSPPMSLEVGNLLITMGVLGFVWLLLMAFLVWRPEFALIMLLFGGMTYIIGRCWFLFIAWEEGLEGFFRSLIIPFYDWFYLYANFERYGRSFGVRLFGALTLAVAALVFRVTDKRDLLIPTTRCRRRPRSDRRLRPTLPGRHRRSSPIRRRHPPGRSPRNRRRTGATDCWSGEPSVLPFWQGFRGRGEFCIFCRTLRRTNPLPFWQGSRVGGEFWIFCTTVRRTNPLPKWQRPRALPGSQSQRLRGVTQRMPDVLLFRPKLLRPRQPAHHGQRPRRRLGPDQG
jgi:hypothetical protein